MARTPESVASFLRGTRIAVAGVSRRSFGQGSVSDEAVQECGRLGLTCIVGGCLLMYCEPVDFPHRCMRAVLRWRGRLPPG
ncbi:MAG: hypothetical protein H0X67_09815 [Acidobacteria bacterium]|nr:hypothetical protein [Acidobacteriota bacterium]